MDFSNRKIWKCLQLLDKQNLNRFEKFLLSPFFVSKELKNNLISVFKLLEEYLIQIKDHDIPEEKLALAISNTSSLDQGKLEKILSQLNQFLFQFIGIEKIMSTNLPEIKTAAYLRESGAKNLWKSQLRKTTLAVEQTNSNSFQNLIELLSLENEKFNSALEVPKEIKEKEYKMIIDAYNDFYIFNMLQLGVQVYSHNKFTFPVDLHSNFESLQNLIEKEKFENLNPEKQVLVAVFRLLTEKDTNNLSNLKPILSFLDKFDSEISRKTKVNIHTIIKNFAIQLYNLGDLSVGKFIFDLYKKGIKNDLLFYESKIQVASIFNIAHCAINEGEFSWLESFMTDIEDKILEQQFKDFTIALIKAKILFAKKSFEPALETLNFNVVNPSLKGYARILEIKALYELKSVQLEYKLEAFKIFMHRIKKGNVTPIFQKGHNNFIGILRSINHPKTEFSLKRVEKIMKRINETEILAERNWLMEKCEGIAAKLK